jgi:hypothetical protein
MKVNRRNTVTCGLSNEEVRNFEAWGTAMGFNLNQALKQCIAYTIKNVKPNRIQEEKVS